MSFEGLEPVPDVTVGAWIGPRLHGFGGRVHCVVPDGFDAYVRILHPASDDEGRPVAWAEVCRRTGRVAHALMQWNRIGGVVSRTSEWPGEPPSDGHLPADVLAQVLDVLAQFTPGDADCFHALWDGWGWLHEGAWGFVLMGDDAQGRPSTPPPAPAGLPDDVMAGPRLRLPGRDHLLFRGPLRAASRMGHQVTERWFSPQSPSLLWPADRSWCLATEIDFDSTLVGGAQELVDAILRAPGLEAWPVEPADDLTYAGDVVNR